MASAVYFKHTYFLHALKQLIMYLYITGQITENK